jgi:hypothetical protein
MSKHKCLSGSSIVQNEAVPSVAVVSSPRLDPPIFDLPEEEEEGGEEEEEEPAFWWSVPRAFPVMVRKCRAASRRHSKATTALSGIKGSVATAAVACLITYKYRLDDIRTKVARSPARQPVLIEERTEREK